MSKRAIKKLKLFLSKLFITMCTKGTGLLTYRGKLITHTRSTSLGRQNKRPYERSEQGKQGQGVPHIATPFDGKASERKPLCNKVSCRVLSQYLQSCQSYFLSTARSTYVISNRLFHSEPSYIKLRSIAYFYKISDNKFSIVTN